MSDAKISRPFAYRLRDGPPCVRDVEEELLHPLACRTFGRSFAWDWFVPECPLHFIRIAFVSRDQSFRLLTLGNFLTFLPFSAQGPHVQVNVLYFAVQKLVVRC